MLSFPLIHILFSCKRTSNGSIDITEAKPFSKAWSPSVSDSVRTPSRKSYSLITGPPKKPSLAIDEITKWGCGPLYLSITALISPCTATNTYSFDSGILGYPNATTLEDLHGPHSCPHELCYCIKELLAFLHEKK